MNKQVTPTSPSKDKLVLPFSQNLPLCSSIYAQSQIFNKEQQKRSAVH